MIYLVFRDDDPESLIEELADPDLPVAEGEQLPVLIDDELKRCPVTKVTGPHLHENKMVMFVWVSVEHS